MPENEDLKGISKLHNGVVLDPNIVEEQVVARNIHPLSCFHQLIFVWQAAMSWMMSNEDTLE